MAHTSVRGSHNSIGGIRSALTILEAMGQRPNGMGVKDVAQLLGQHRTTAYRLLSTLVDTGFVHRSPDGLRYWLSLRLVELAGAILEQLPIHEVARPFLIELRDDTREGVHLGVLDGADVVYIDRVEALQPIRYYSYVGSRFSAHASGIGKVLLAYLPDADRARIITARPLERFTTRTVSDPRALARHLKQIRRRGYAIADEEYRRDYRSVAVPILGPAGQALAGISVSGPAYRLPVDLLTKWAPTLVSVAGRISRALGVTSIAQSEGGPRGVA